MKSTKFILNNIFTQNAKEYQTKPVKAMKYQPGMETGFIVHFTNIPTNERKVNMHEGMKFFDTESEAWDYINSNPDQYVNENGKLIKVDVEYMKPLPVLHRKVNNPDERVGYIGCHEGKYAFVSNESEQYDFFYLDSDIENTPSTWIIQDTDGNIRVWDSDFWDCCGITFFGNPEDFVYQKVEDNYIKVAI